MPQSLSYLLFDATDEESGACAFDAMASVLPDRLPALLAEVQAVLAWATHLFGPACNDDDEGDAGDWAFELQTTDVAGADGRVTLTLTISGHSAFAEAFRQAFVDAQQ